MNKIERKRVCIVINPISGLKNVGVEAYKKLVESKIDQEKYIPEFYFTEYSGHASKIATDECESGVRFFLVAGGDGTVNEVAAQLAGRDAIMGIIPFGSGNGLAHHLEIPVKTSEAISIFNRGKVLKIDTCSVNDKFFVSIAGIGFDARIARQFAESNRRGFMTYARIVFKEYFTYKQRKYILKLDGEEIKTSAFFISFANSSQFGYNTRIAPNASITDGKIDVCIVRKPPVSALPLVAHQVYRRRIDRSKYMDIIQATMIRVERKKGKTVNIDGEPVKMKQFLKIDIRPASLAVVVP